MLDSSEISIVIQGPLYRTPRTSKSVGIFQSLPSLREIFPNSEIIISTWDTENIEGLDADKILINQDPGGFADINGSTRNFNRQICSTLAGLKACTRKYVLKTRADLLFLDSRFVDSYQNELGSVLKSKVIVSNLYIRNPAKIPYLFHLSDVVSFGALNDQIDIWDIPLEKESDLEGLRISSLFWRFSSSRFIYHPEQSLCKRWLFKHGYEFSPSYPADIRLSWFLKWSEVLLNNFTVVDYGESGIEFPPQFFTSAYGVRSTNYFSEDLCKLRQNHSSVFMMKWIYLKILINKYVLCIFQPTFFLSVTSNILIKLSPQLHGYIFSIYRKMRSR